MVEQLWKQSLERLRTEVDAQSFATWIAPIRPTSFENGVLSLQVPSTFMADWLQRHFLGVIISSVKVYEPACREVVIAQRRQSTGGLITELPIVMDDEPGLASAPLPAAQRRGLHNLNPKNTFDSFVVGPSNNFACAASLAVARSPGESYNPLFLYGGVGLGKTHLMQAIGHDAWERHPGSTVLYMTSEVFTNELIAAIQSRSTGAFRAKYRSIDVLLIDDIQFLSGRDSTQDEFFHTFNTLYDAHRQIVMSSDRSPKDIRGLEERLVSRFQWGLVTDIQAPDVETRVAILRAKAEREKVDLPQDVAHFIAQAVTTNIRELEGALIRVTAFGSMMSKPVTLELAQAALRDLLTTPAPKPLSIDRIQQAVGSHYDVRLAELKSSKRSRQIAFPRQVAMYLCRELTSASLEDVGDAFGGRDHTTVMHGYRKIAEEKERDPALRQTLHALTQALQGDPRTDRG